MSNMKKVGDKEEEKGAAPQGGSGVKPTPKQEGVTGNNDPLGLCRDPLDLIVQVISCIKNGPKGIHGELSVGQKLALMKLDAALVLLRVGK